MAALDARDFAKKSARFVAVAGSRMKFRQGPWLRKPSTPCVPDTVLRRCASAAVAWGLSDNVPLVPPAS
jgi:hypothetical protein